MKRRNFLFTAIAAAALLGASAQAGDVEFAPGVIEEALANGETVFVDYFAPWCSTCRTQERVIGALRSDNPEYNEKITFVRVDWDTYKDHEVTTSRNIPRRSTLLLLKGDEELGRIVAGTSEKDIKALLDKGL